MTLLLSYVFYFITATVSPLQRRFIAKKKATDTNGQILFAFQITSVLVILSFLLPFFQPFSLHGNIAQIILLAFVCGIFGAGFLIASYSAQKFVDASVTTVASNIYTPTTIILASVFLNEKLTLVQILGTILLLAGMLIVSKKHRISTFKFDKYFLLIIMSGIMLGITLTAERALQKITGFTAGTMLSWWMQFIFLGITAMVVKGKNNYTKKDISITGFLWFLQYLSWLILVFVAGNLSYISAVTTFKVILIAIAAAIFLKERDDLPKKLLGAIVAVAGLLLMR